MICVTCGKRIPNSVKFCIYCGSDVKTESLQTSTQQRFCRKCGSELEQDALFCDQCGCRIVPITDVEVEEKTVLPTEELITELPIDGNLGFIGLNEFVIDEKLTGMMFENSYVIYDMEKRIVGAVQQAKLSNATKVFRGLTGVNTKNMQAFKLTLLDPSGKKLGVIYRNGSAWADIIIEDGEGRQIVSSKMRSGGLKDNATGQMICKFSAWGIVNHKMMDDEGNVIAEISHKWNGAKSLFTTADKYHVSISPELRGDMRRIICSIAVAFDIIAGIS